MSFHVFPRHNQYGPSNWKKTVQLKKSPTDGMLLALQVDANPSYTDIKSSSSCPDLTQLRKSSLRTTESAPASPVLKSVKFNSTHLEQVCLFYQAQTPMELRKPSTPRLALHHVSWPRRETTFYSKNILIDRKFGLSPQNDAIIGRVQVRNLAYQKSVSVHFTFDCWRSVQDMDATFVKTSAVYNGVFEMFEFTIPLTDALSGRGVVRATLDFAVRYRVGDQEFWDNNEGQNYKIEVVAETPTVPELDEEVDELDEDALEIPMVRKQQKHPLGNRYSFGQSLSQAKKITQSLPEKTKPIFTVSQTPFERPAPLFRTNSPTAYPVAAPTAIPTSHATLPDLNSASYHDLVNKYCFYGSERTPSPVPINI